MSPRFVARLVDGKYQVVSIDDEAVFCPFCNSRDLEPDVSYKSVISGVQVDWYNCQGCGASVEIIAGRQPAPGPR